MSGGGHEFQINHLFFMDDLKLFGKSYEQIDSLVQTVHTFSIDAKMQKIEMQRWKEFYYQMGRL